MTAPSAEDAKNAVEYLNNIGTAGLLFIVYCLMTRRLITRGEFDKEIGRSDKLEARLDHALHNNERAIEYHDKLADRLPAKN